MIFDKTKYMRDYAQRHKASLNAKARVRYAARKAAGRPKKHSVDKRTPEQKAKYARERYRNNPDVQARNKETNKRWIENNRERHRTRAYFYEVRRKFGLTREKFNALLARQNGCCALCGVKFVPGKKREMAVDHCHTTGKVRGLLHLSCNALIRMAREDEDILTKAIEYVKNHCKNRISQEDAEHGIN